MESLAQQLQHISLDNLPADLVTFYYGVVRKENVSNDVDSNRKTLSRLRRTYANKLRRDDPCSVSFDSVDVRSAYVFQFCPSFSLATAAHFSLMMKNLSHTQLLRLAQKDTLTICCLGGGPGSEIVAICRVLKELRRSLAAGVQNPMLVDATVIDVEAGWSTTAELVVGSLSELVDPSVVRIDRFRFVRHDFTTDLSGDVRGVLGRSDVVTMVKFLSALHSPGIPMNRTAILQDTWNCIPVNGMLFLMDSSGWIPFDEMSRTVSSFVQVEPVYGPAKKTSRLSKTSKNICISQSALYGHQCCTTRSCNKAAAWVKAPPTNGLGCSTAL